MRSTIFAFLALVPVAASATTYQVGPSRPYANLQALAALLAPGDLVEVDGNVTYPGGAILDNSGTLASPITIRGLRVNGNRPRIHGGGDGVKFVGDYYVFEGFEVTGDAALPTNRCLFPGSQGMVIRDSVVHDCPRHGILGADGGSGDLTLEFVEVHHTGSGTQYHQVYVATDNTLHPTAVFRMRYCYIHDANGGNSVKSRAGRNEITYNWIEGALYHELDLIGADGQPAGLVREDSDVVGNVLIKTAGTPGLIARIGGDGTGDSAGRFRFLNNTMILRGQPTAFRLQDSVESLELHNNVIYRTDGAGFNYIRTAELLGTCLYSGQRNWVPANATGVRPEWTGTLTGTNPGFLDVASLDLRPAPTSPLHDAGLLPTTSPAGAPFPNPLAAPGYVPPRQRLIPPGFGKLRPGEGTAIDIGAWEATRLGPRGDQDGDGQPDLLLRNTVTGEHQVWLMNGVTRLGSPLSVAPATGPLLVVGADDIDGDQHSDFVVRDPATGAVEFWLMNGATRVGAPLPLLGPPSPPLDWQLAATGDFNHDAHPDLLWRSQSTQDLVVWLMNGPTFLAGLTPNPSQAVQANWSVTAALDYDNDGNRDLLWYNATTGKIVLWRMDGNVQRLSGDFTLPSNAGNANWKVVAGGDYGLGTAGVLASNDIVWRNDTSGKLVVWHMDPDSVPLTRTFGEFTSPDSPSPNPLDWRVVGPK